MEVLKTGRRGALCSSMPPGEVCQQVLTWSVLAALDASSLSAGLGSAEPSPVCMRVAHSRRSGHLFPNALYMRSVLLNLPSNVCLGVSLRTLLVWLVSIGFLFFFSANGSCQAPVCPRFPVRSSKFSCCCQCMKRRQAWDEEGR